MSALSYNQEGFGIEQFEGELKRYDPLDSCINLSLSSFKFIKALTGILGILALAIALSPIIALFLWSVTLMYKRLARKFSAIKKEAIVEINKSSFEDLKEFEKITDKLYTTLKKMHKEMASAKNLWVFKGFYRAVESIYNDLTEMRKAAENRYHFCMKDLFSSEEEYNKYCEELKGLGDIWEYETSDAERKVVFDLKNPGNKSK